MQTGYKERIVLHALHPRKRNASNPVTMASFVFYASLFDLAERGIFKIESGKIYCQEKETGEPVLDKLLSILVI